MSDYSDLLLMRFRGKRIQLDNSGGKPVKPHVKNENMSESYHRRIVKKWIKRFGLTPSFVPAGQVIFDDNENRIIMNAATYQHLLSTTQADKG